MRFCNYSISGVSSQFGMGLFSAMGWIWVVVAFVGIRFYYKKKNESIAARNAQILVDNERIKAQEQTVLAELQQIQIAYREKIGSWYPSTYCYAEAAQFFYEVISNYRADNMKEAINLYENTLHQRRMEDNQKQMLKQQKLNNLLAAGSFVMQTAQVGAIQEHTAAMNSQAEATRSAIGRNTDALNKINEKLSRPTWLK